MIYMEVMRTQLASVFEKPPKDTDALTVSGWVRNIRVSKSVGFIELNDGTAL